MQRCQARRETCTTLASALDVVSDLSFSAVNMVPTIARDLLRKAIGEDATKCYQCKSLHI